MEKKTYREVGVRLFGSWAGGALSFLSGNALWSVLELARWLVLRRIECAGTRRQATLERTRSGSCVLVAGSAHAGVLDNDGADHSMRSGARRGRGWWRGGHFRGGREQVCCAAFEDGHGGGRCIQVSRPRIYIAMLGLCKRDQVIDIVCGVAFVIVPKKRLRRRRQR